MSLVLKSGIGDSTCVFMAKTRFSIQIAPDVAKGMHNHPNWHLIAY